MYEVFFRKFNDRVPLTAEEEIFIQQYLSSRKLRRRQFLLQEGDICKHICLVEKGALKAYLVDGKGEQHITAFAFEGWMIADLPSFFREEPATQNIDALEDCELVLISKSAHEELLEKMPKYGTYIRLLITDAYVALQQRTTSMLHLSVEERYRAFTRMCQTIHQRVPQHMVASFMGLSPETLSRVRSRLNRKKDGEPESY